jgi:predicted nuclease with TOPRIM domain
MAVYHTHLRKIIDLMRVDQIQDWCNQLMDVSRVLAEAVAEQQEIQAKFEPLLDDELGREEISRLEEEIEELIVMNSKLLEDEAVLQCQVADAEEELFQVMQELAAYEEPVDPDDMVTCPVCKEKPRNCLLVGCGHPVCWPAQPMNAQFVRRSLSMMT